MSIHQHLLFHKHVADLQHVYANATEVFICPICFLVFTQADLESEKLSIGHVWPRFIREQNETVKHQQVLLCKSCNSRAGENADAAMQEFARLKRQITTDPTSVLFSMEILNPDNPELGTVKFKASVEPTGENQLNIYLEAPKKQPPPRSFINMHSRIESYLQRENPTLNIQPIIPDLHLATYGWLTSAYLLSFYAFGYRYILQSALDPVRQSIRESFEGKVDSRLSTVDASNMCVAIMSEGFFDSPRFRFSLKIPYRVEVWFQDILTCLPFWYTSSPITGEARQLTKTELDNLFGEPEYVVNGNILVRKPDTSIS